MALLVTSMLKSFLNILMGCDSPSIFKYGDATPNTTQNDVTKPKITGVKDGGGNSDVIIPWRALIKSDCNKYPNPSPANVAKMTIRVSCII